MAFDVRELKRRWMITGERGELGWIVTRRKLSTGTQRELVRVSMLDVFSGQDWVEARRGRYSDDVQQAIKVNEYSCSCEACLPDGGNSERLRLPNLQARRRDGRVVFAVEDGNHRSFHACRLGILRPWAYVEIERGVDRVLELYEGAKPFLKNYVSPAWLDHLPVRGNGRAVGDYVPNWAAPAFGLPVVRRTLAQTVVACRINDAEVRERLGLHPETLSKLRRKPTDSTGWEKVVARVAAEARKAGRYAGAR